MQIQPVIGQPNFKGKIVFEPCTTKKLTENMPNPLLVRFKEVSKLISEKPYNLYISKKDADFYNIAANTTLEEARKVKLYTVKVKINSITESIVDAANEAMEIYEKFISKTSNKI